MLTGGIGILSRCRKVARRVRPARKDLKVRKAHRAIRATKAIRVIKATAA
jgi:hypothetical protein